MGFKYRSLPKPLSYEELVFQAISSEKNEFEYHNHFFTIQKIEDGSYEVISGGEKVADVIIEENEKIVLIDERKREYIRNTRSVYYESLYGEELRRSRTRPYPELPHDEI